jgi:hypothetical protein
VIILILDRETSGIKIYVRTLHNHEFEMSEYFNDIVPFAITKIDLFKKTVRTS